MACERLGTVTAAPLDGHTPVQGVATALVQRVAETALGATEHADNAEAAQQLVGVAAAQLSRLCFVIGHVGLQHLVRVRPEPS